MGHIYTPGLKVTEFYRIRKRRILPLKGETLVRVGDRVTPDDVVAKADLPGRAEPVNVANLLGIPATELALFMKYKEGDAIEKGEVIAENKGFFGLFKTQIRSPVKGTIENISTVTGQVLVRSEPIPVEVKAYIRGKVVEVVPEEGAVVEAVGSFIQGIFGIGGERHGKITVVVSSPEEVLDETKIRPEHQGRVLVGGSMITASAIRRAEEYRVSGIVVGGIDDRDLRDFIGYDIGVAITGNEDINTTLVISEGFGEMPMAERTFALLKKYEGKDASISGATQIRAGVIRPEVVIPLEDVTEQRMKEIEKRSEELPVLSIGSLMRVIRIPYFGKIGKVVALPPELQKLESETSARVLEIEFPDGTRAIVPRANVEVIEE
ncbi:MAG: hypothetical protein B6D65_04775 [candidate division Zixibacteria bacterium 4484_93]|nr:MAG: hypothetical protein B6D65_04775 [candidate division Zixibacteria bacterium 4484_93]